MRSEPKYMIYQDLIGVKLYAKHKFNPTWTQFREIGIVEDETKNVLLVQQDQKTKKYLKDQYFFQCWLQQPEGTALCIEFDGQKIVGRPEQRIKLLKKYRRKYH
jgi:RNase P/RNase MRP subunit p29